VNSEVRIGLGLEYHSDQHSELDCPIDFIEYGLHVAVGVPGWLRTLRNRTRADLTIHPLDVNLAGNETLEETYLQALRKQISTGGARAAPAYFKTHPEPRKPQDLLEHNCINLRLPTHGNVYAWEFEKSSRELKVRVEGQLTFNGTAQLLNGALAGCGLAYVPEGLLEGHVAKGRLRRVLADWCRPYSSSTRVAGSPRRHSRSWSILCASDPEMETPEARSVGHSG
jgi:DNA-binding transcriptional LysR family regulator